jgi:hypothetical protein
MSEETSSMNQAIGKGLVPPRPGLEREEPELAQEEDIPADDGTLPEDDTALPLEPGEAQPEQRPLRQVERE